MEPTLTRQSVQGITVATQTIPEEGAVTNLKVTRQHIVLALDNTQIYVFNSDGTYRKTLQGHTKTIWGMAICKDTLVGGGIGGDIWVWDLVTGECKSVLLGHTGTVRCIKFIDEKTVVSGSRDGTLLIWDLDTGVCEYKLEGHDGTVRCLDVSAHIVVSGGKDATCKVWSRAGKCLRTLSGHGGCIYALALSEQGQVATGSLDNTVRIWDVESGCCVGLLEGHSSLVSQIEIHDKTLVSGGADGHVILWSVETMKLLNDLPAHQGGVTSLQATGDRLITGGSDGCVKLWDLQTGQLIRQVGESAMAVWKVAFGAGDSIITTLRKEENLLELWDT